jgi:murein DD-endopeptidase MepM/ murein hydrolase activator NlpD
MTTYQTYHIRRGFDGLTLASFAFIVFAGLMLVRDIRSQDAESMIVEEGIEKQLATGSAEVLDEGQEIGSGREIPTSTFNDILVAAPYDHYTLTQGPHGFSYGHMAIDISAGKGAVIKSPVAGYVTEHSVDQYGNPTLVIENDFYRVTMLHGKYKVESGEAVEIGQMVGRESNMGYTTDIWGRSCRDRDCGYHTHLNIFDKRIGSNVNPLSLIE